MPVLRPVCTLLICMCLLSGGCCFAQGFILPNAYSHNDYWRRRPLYDALDNGFTYVEADVFLRNKKLIVTHILPCFKKKRTLQNMYLDPLLHYVENASNDAHVQKGLPVTLMIDIKSGATSTFNALVTLLQKYRHVLTSRDNGIITARQVTVVVTGHKPSGIDESDCDGIVFFDEDLKKSGQGPKVNLYPIASCKYSSIIRWRGKGEIPDSDIQHLQAYVNMAHRNGTKVRLWASPEKKAVWQELLRCNVDLINTNRIKSLRNFLVSDLLLVARKE